MGVVARRALLRLAGPGVGEGLAGGEEGVELVEEVVEAKTETAALPCSSR